MQNENAPIVAESVAAPLTETETGTETTVTTPPIVEAVATEPAARHINSVDATTGQPMVERITARKLELEALLAGLPESDQDTRKDIDATLAAINGLLTGDLTNVPPVVVADMNRVLERSKHIGERAPADAK